MSADPEERENELLALQSIFTSEEFIRGESKAAGEIRVSAELPEGFAVSIKEGERVRQYEITFLPPLSLTFELPEDYPSSSPPSFTLSCSWLTEKQLTSLGDQLTDIYQASSGAVVLFDWVQFLREDALRFLKIDAKLELHSEEQDTGDSSVDPEIESSDPMPKTCNDSDSTIVGRKAEQIPQTSQLIEKHENGPSSVAVESESNLLDVQEFLDGENGSASSPLPSNSSGLTDNSGQEASSLSVMLEDIHQKQSQYSDLQLTPSQKLMSQILINDAAQLQKRFATTLFDCEVCFMSYLGSDCLQLLECGHIFCRTCSSEYFSVQIKEGNVEAVLCPHADCTTRPAHAQVKDLVQEELFNRYDRLLLQKTLDGMSDVVYCPRLTCGVAVIREESGQVAMCSVCGFAFCVACRKTYHGTGSCDDDDIPEETENTPEYGSEALPQSKGGLMALWHDYTEGSKKRKKLLEDRYGRRAFRVTLSSYLSKDWIQLYTKHCPHCFCRIEKNGGCNHMFCIQCKRTFNWD